MNRIVQFIKDITRPLRNFFSRFFMSENERRAVLNHHSIIELAGRKILYSVEKEDILRKKKHVIYTCITGNYDNLIQQTYYNQDYSYVCYTDNEDWIKEGIIGIWQIRPLVKNNYTNVLNNRWHKTHPHELFPDYEDSIYMDGNIDILHEGLFNRINAKLPADLIIPRHFARDCVYQEIQELRKTKKISKKELEKMKSFLLKESFPQKYGLNENNVIYRKHASERIKEIMEEWWELILNVAPRDQLSLSYVLWKNNIKPEDIAIDNVRFFYDEVAFYYGEHK